MKGADLVVCSVSGGKDSVAMLHAVKRAIAGAIPLYAIHAAIDGFAWPDGVETVQSQSRSVGVPCMIVRSTKGFLERVRERREWPMGQYRWCTSDHKRTPLNTAVRRLAARYEAHKVVVSIGERSAESESRARKASVIANKSLTTKTRTVTTVRPIQQWSDADVWRYVAIHQLPLPRSYKLGFKRHGCPYCIYADKHQRGLADNLAELEPIRCAIRSLEAEIGHVLFYDTGVPVNEAAGQLALFTE